MPKNSDFNNDTRSIINPDAAGQTLAMSETDKHLFDAYQAAYIGTNKSDLFPKPQELFDQYGNLYNDETDIDLFVEEMTAFASTELQPSALETDQQSEEGLNQKTLKSMKKEIGEDGALQVGYFEGVTAKMIELDPMILAKTISSAGGWVAETLEINAAKAMSNKPNEFDNVLVTEMVRNLNYQDFKEIAPYFFSYQKALNERTGQDEILAESVPDTDLLKTSIHNGSLLSESRKELKEPHQQATKGVQKGPSTKTKKGPTR